MFEKIGRRASAAVLGLLLIVAPAGAWAAPPADVSEASARSFVQGFYDWYLGKVLGASKAKSATDFGFIDAVRQRPGWFSPELKRLLEEDIAAASRCKGDIVGLDWDPFLETQDPAPTYTAGKVEKTAKGFRVSVDFHNKTFGGARNPAAQADVVFVDGHWLFADFVEEPTDPKERQGLVALLKSFERSGEYKCPK
jgi:hypothetical protein